jgi:hypothetical protein
VIEASLDFGLRPNFTDSADDGYLAIHSNYKGMKAVSFELLKPGEDIFISFF